MPVVVAVNMTLSSIASALLWLRPSCLAVTAPVAVKKLRSFALSLRIVNILKLYKQVSKTSYLFIELCFTLNAATSPST